MENLSNLWKEDSSAGEEAKRRGLTHVGWGRYADKQGKVTHKAQNGKLIPVTPKGLRSRGDPNYLYRPGTNLPAVKRTDTGFKRLTPKRPPEVQRIMNKPRDRLDPELTTTDTVRRFVSKVDSKIFDSGIENYREKYPDGMPMDDFTKLTGISEKEIKVYGKYKGNVDPYEEWVWYEPSDGRVHIGDPMDV